MKHLRKRQIKAAKKNRLRHMDTIDLSEINRRINFAIEEFEKVKAEILSEYPLAESDKAKLIGYGIHIALEYIDKRIEELKGENK